MVISGSGYAVSVLGPLSWLGDLEVIYWGDIDTHGFVILDRLRAMFPKPSQAHDVLTRLDAAEAALYEELLAGSLGARVRLEQERIGYGVTKGRFLPQHAR
jgi:hypothetical protein